MLHNGPLPGADDCLDGSWLVKLKPDGALPRGAVLIPVEWLLSPDNALVCLRSPHVV